MSLLLYNLLLPFALLAMLPGALRKLRQRGGSWRDLQQRFGLLGAPERAALATISHYENRFWFHAVSVGEVGVAIKIISPLLQRDPGAAIVLTTTTPTGHAIAKDFASTRNGRVAVLYSPIDIPFIVHHLLTEISPRRLVLVEAEVWPNLVAQAGRLGIPITLANARLSSRSERRFRQFGLLTRPVFARLDQVLVQEPEDIARWAALGVNSENLHQTGSVKYDPEGPAIPQSTLDQFRRLLSSIGIQQGERPILIAASTHPGEERTLAEAYLRLLESPSATSTSPAFLIVPRHVERTAAITKELAALGLSPILRSTLAADGSQPASFSPHRPLLIDTTGELNAWQHLSDIVIIGKSFLSHGGQNPAEAALAGKPVIFGPNMENFEPLVKLLLQAGAAIQVPDTTRLPLELRSLLENPAEAARLGAAGHQALSRHAGAARRTLDFLLATPTP